MLTTSSRKSFTLECTFISKLSAAEEMVKGNTPGEMLLKSTHVQFCKIQFLFQVKALPNILILGSFINGQFGVLNYFQFPPRNGVETETMQQGSFLYHIYFIPVCDIMLRIWSWTDSLSAAPSDVTGGARTEKNVKKGMASSANPCLT